jgi:DNA (cytosine-5)-methyltransferase 3A
MKVLSLFDGISVLRCALGDRKVEYLASEIDKYAIQVSKKNYPDITHIGDVTKVSDISDIYLLCGGSPCIDLSIAKKDRKGLEGEHSSLFWEWVRIWKESKPKYFILENVASMPKKDRDIITAELGVQPIMINASLVSAQNRKRLFWTNITVVGLPINRGIVLKDILEPGVEGSITQTFTALKGKSSGAIKVGYIGEGEQYGQGGQAHRVYSAEGKTPTLSSSEAGLVQIGHVGNSNGQANRVYSAEGKSVTLSANGGGLGAKTGLYDLSTLNQRQKNNLRTEDDKAFCLTSTNYKGSQANGTTLVEQPKSKIRKLTPMECERLQSLPDNYTAGISNTQRYRCLGNAFNCEVIKFILSFMPIPDE